MIFASMDMDPTDILQYFGDLAVPTPLQYADFVFWGAEGSDVGPGAPSICVERKRIRDAVNSLIYTKRLVQQVSDARAIHRYVYLVVEGLWQPGDDGLLEIRAGGGWQPVVPTVAYSEFEQRLNTLTHHGGVIMKRTSTPKETAQVIINLYNWWQDRQEEHTTMRTFFDPVRLSGRFSLLRRWAKELPGVGWELSDRVEREFATALEMAEASVRQWRGVHGIGKGKAEIIVRAIRGGEVV